MQHSVCPVEKTLPEFEVSEPQRTWMQRLAIEKGGIQRVTDDQRQENTTKFWNACTFWYATFPFGYRSYLDTK